MDNRFFGDHRYSIQEQYQYLQSEGFRNPNQCTAVLEALQSSNMSQLNKIELLTKKSDNKLYATRSLANTVIKFHGLEVWKQLIELLDDIFDKLKNEIDSNNIKPEQLQCLYELMREHGEQLTQSLYIGIQINHIKLLRKLLKADQQPAEIMKLLWFVGNIPFSEQLFARMQPKNLSAKSIELAVEFLELLLELKNNNASMALIIKQFNPRDNSDWSFLKFIIHSEHPLLTYHFINLGLANQEVFDVLSYMKDKIFSHLLTQPDEVARKMLDVILDPKSPFKDWLCTPQFYFKPNPTTGTWEKMVALSKTLKAKALEMQPYPPAWRVTY